jgi:purine-binding chemotaxis protein CheW
VAGPRQLCTFRVDGLLVAIDARRVQEVVRPQELTRVPLAPRAVRGLMNLRGDILTAIDLRTRLHLPERSAGESVMSVVVATEHGSVGLIVDAAGDVLELGQETFEPPPQTLRGGSRALIIGAYKLADRLLLLLDVDRVLGVRVDTEEAIAPGRETP